MKRMKLLLLALILITTTAMPAFGISTPIIVDPIDIGPILTLPLMPVFYNTKTVSTIPLYRLYNSSLDKHTYTSLSNEKSDLLGEGWVDDGIVAYVSPVKLPGLYALHRYNVLGQTLLTGISNPLAPWWFHTGIVGYVAEEFDYYAQHDSVHESARALEEGDSYLDGNLYYSSDKLLFLGMEVGPAVPNGYNLTGNTFNMWESSLLVQDIEITSNLINLTGGSSVSITWTTQAEGGLVTLMYSSDNGATWYTIAEDLSNSAGQGSQTWTVPNTTNNETKLRALWKSEMGESATAWDTSSAFSITADPGIITLIPIDPGISILVLKPATPTNLAANASVISKEISLYWTDNSATETGYTIERKTDGGIFAEIATVDINETTYTDTSITANVVYTYRIKATGAVMDSNYSNEVAAQYTGFIVVPLLPDGFVMPEFPDPPQNLQLAFTDGSESEILISWDPPSGDFTGFKVERNTGLAWLELGNTTEDDYDFVDTDLTGLSGDILYRVKSYDEALTSVPTTAVSINLDEEMPEIPQIPEDPTPLADIFDGSQSGWAEAELLEAYNNGLTYPGVMYDYDRAITREEFCTIAVKLFEELTGLGVIPGEDPFDDTDNPAVLKAYKLGIVNGISDTEFAPALNITRQEMCVMIYRTLTAARYDTSVDPMAAFPFTDAGDIASWAINEVKFCYQNSIMNGTSPTTIDPLLNTPREQAIILVGRTYTAFVTP